MASSTPERIDLPSGESLWYVDADHSYWRHNEKTGRRGTRLTGVTTVVKTLDYDPGKLLGWAAKTQCIGIAERFGEGGATDWLSSQESIVAELEARELTWEHVRDRAGQKGTRVHELALQALALGRPVPDLDLLTDEEQGLACGVMAFWLDHEPEPEQVEQIVYSERLGVAGRLDFRGTLSLCEDDACACHEVAVALSGVIDLKTGNYISAAAHAQVGGGYPLLSKESGFGESAWALILKVRDDGSYELARAYGSPAGFEAAVATYREAGRITRESGKAYKARKAAREAVLAA